MTTIACDGKSMAGDGHGYVNGTICSRSMVKVFRLTDGSLYGACGDDGDGQRHKAWVEAGCQGNAPEKLEEHFGALCLRPNGDLFEAGSTGLLCLIEAPFAIGSGLDLAIGAMEAGASAEGGVEVACRRNPHTGGKITTLYLIPLSALEAA